MVAVDLVPNEFKTSVIRRKRLRLWICAVIATATAAFAWAGLNYLNFRREDQAMQQLAEQSQDIEKNISQLNNTKLQLDLWRDRIAVIDKLGRYPDYIAITGYLSQHSPELIYLKEMSFSRSDAAQPTVSQQNLSTPLETMPKAAAMFLLKDEQSPDDSTKTAATDNTKPIVMILKGYSLDYQTVADYLKVLRDSNLFLDVKLKHTKRHFQDASKTVDFEIQSILSPHRSSIGVDYADLRQTKNL